MRLRLGIVGSAFVCAALMVIAAPASAEKFEVCKQGCDYRKIQDAVDASRKNDTIIVEPGKYKEGVIVKGPKHNGLTIKGAKKNAKKVILEGKNATNVNGVAQNGIEGKKVNRLRLMNMWARNYATNGFFVHDGCTDYLMKNLIASYNRAYGLYAFNCKGGRMTKSVGYGHGDSAFYVGATPLQSNPKQTRIDHVEAYLNVIGWSGTNSHYIKIAKSDFYNNGVGIVPSTLDSEPYEPSSDGVIENNNIFWNNFNYFGAESPVTTISRGLGELNGQTVNFPTGVGVVNLGVTDWTVRDNQIFGHYRWGVATVSNPLNEGGDAIATNTQVIDNQMGRNGTDTNEFDFFSQGSGKGNCFSGNTSSTFDPSPTASNAVLYPPCPSPNVGSGDSTGNDAQFGELVGYVTTDPPEKQQCAWTVHPHPPFEGFKPYETPGVTCP